MLINSVKLPHFNSAAESKTTTITIPAQIVMNLSQNIGAPCEAVVKKGDVVKTGQIIGDSDAFVSAPVHSSVTGTIKDEIEIVNINGKLNKALVIETADRQMIYEELKPPVINTTEDFIAAVRHSGSVGLGGAGFPTHVKLSYDRTKIKIDTLIVNGAECEPYITSDYREIMENTEDVIKGIKLVMKYLSIENAIIGIEKDKPKAIEKISTLSKFEKNISVLPLKTKYPQGAEKVLIYRAVGRIIKEGELPMSVGCLVMNSSTIAFIARYIATGIPLINRRITIDGNIVNRPANVMVPIGTRLADIISYANLRNKPDRIIFGGPMMGNCVYDFDMPISKTTSAVLMFFDSPVIKESSCIRCGKCIGACPMKLMPVLLEKAYIEKDIEALKKLKLNTCLGCGSCTYICSAKRNIVERNNLAKAFLRNNS